MRGGRTSLCNCMCVRDICIKDQYKIIILKVAIPSERVVVFSRKNNIYISRALCITESESSSVETSIPRICVRKVLNSTNESHE